MKSVNGTGNLRRLRECALAVRSHHRVDRIVGVYKCVIEPLVSLHPRDPQVLHKEGCGDHSHVLLHLATRPELPRKHER